MTTKGSNHRYGVLAIGMSMGYKDTVLMTRR